jgi:ATP-dependent helicase HrpB
VIDFSRTQLPLVPYLAEISRALKDARALALSAEPGAGKSTLVPPYLIDEPWLAGRSIIMLEPRRLAAVAVAMRIAELLSEPVGRRAGYRVRTSSRVSRDTRIEVVTEALLTRRIQEDPLLEGVGLVIFDELHERSLHADLALALALEVRRARPDLALLAMSATLDAGPVSSVLGSGSSSPAPYLHCPGTLHPVRVEYRPISRERTSRWEEVFADGIARIFEETDGGVLAFLPGAAEIRRVGARLSAAVGGRGEVLPLHGTLRLEDQRRVIRPPDDGKRRIILATSIAETSLTVPGITAVADSGLARLARFHLATGLDRLVTEAVSAVSAEQRRGRAGRRGPGLCVRFWPESQRLVPRQDPEILRSDLSGLVLECALWGARGPDELSWMDPPSAAPWTQAREVLVMLGLVDDSGATPMGKTVAGLGLPPRLGVLVLRGAASGHRMLAAACAAILQERDGSGIERDPDFRLRLEAIRSGVGGAGSWRSAVEAEMGRIARRLGPASAQAGYGWTEEQERGAGALLAGAFPDRLGRREPDGTYRLVTGRTAAFAGRPGNPTRAAGPWIVALDADAGETTGTIRLAAPVAAEQAERTLADAASEALEVRWEGLVPRGILVRRAGRLTLTERPQRLDPHLIVGSFLRELERRGLSLLPWNRQSRRLLARLRFHARTRPDEAGDFSDSGLISTAPEWLVPRLNPAGGHVIGPGGLSSALCALARRTAGRIDELVPAAIRLPTGAMREIDYEGAEPAVEARIQEVFGLAKSPLICGVPLTFRLLSPAHRPLQVTRDLESFWRVTYAQVRKEMRGRYPKHYWPEDPLAAEPTSRARPRRPAT